MNSPLTISVDGTPTNGRPGQTIAGILLTSGRTAWRRTSRGLGPARAVLRHRGLLRLPGHGERRPRRPGLPAPGERRRCRGDPVMTRTVVIIGAGPAGLSAASSALDRGASVTLLDAADQLGGQYWRHPPSTAADADRCAVAARLAHLQPAARRPRGRSAMPGADQRARLGDRARLRSDRACAPRTGRRLAPSGSHLPAGRAGARHRRSRPHPSLPWLGSAGGVHRRCGAGVGQVRRHRAGLARRRGRRRTVPAPGRGVPDRHRCRGARDLRSQPGAAAGERLAAAALAVAGHGGQGRRAGRICRPSTPPAHPVLPRSRRRRRPRPRRRSIR